LFDASHDESPGFEPVERWPVPVSLFHDLVG
jgi:hypothetical protein